MENDFKLILGSSSPSRFQQMQQLQLPFTQASPDIDETPQSNENASTLVKRLSILKAQALAPSHKDSLIISSDQVMELDNAIVGKPYTAEKAHQQLQACSGKTVTFYNGLCLLNTKSGDYQYELATTQVSFKPINLKQIKCYIERDHPLTCAGSIRMEKLAIALIDKISSDDPYALMGLSLLSLVRMLENEGINLLA